MTKESYVFTAILFLTVFFFMGTIFQLDAKVTGLCSNCHTMHNSQDGSSVFRDGDGTGWNGSGQLVGGAKSTTPADRLLVTSCIGCHSSSSGSTIINVGSSKIPIVYNTGGYPTQPLAGGNFYYVAQGGAANDVYGHNVYGISDPDENINEAPGNINCGGYGFEGLSCHYTLAEAPQLANFNKGGCEGCHFRTTHHEDNGSYRFLWAHESDDHYVDGVEDDDWEQETSDDHNWYKGVDGPVYEDALDVTHSISTFCAGCHHEFHRRDHITDQTSSPYSPWKRHPTDILLPNSGEYAGYNPPTAYSAEAPVGYTDPSTPTRGTAVVMCLSCHRPHGSEYPDMLRWDYSDMEVGTTGAAANTGCFTCHRDKDGS
jgi:predicted CXXCH cytochrome family protein